MSNPAMEQTIFSEIKVNLSGALMADGRIHYKTLMGILEGLSDGIEGAADVANLRKKIEFTISPPREGSFEITMFAQQALGVTATLLQQAGNVKNVTDVFFEYLKIKKALMGEKLVPALVSVNASGGVSVKNKSGSIVYNDNRKIITQTFVFGAMDHPKLNKAIEKVATTIQRDSNIDTLSLSAGDTEEFQISRTEADFFEFDDSLIENKDGLVGSVRKIDNKTYKGTLTILSPNGEQGVNFELDIEDIGRLEAITRNLALAEAQRSRVRLIGKKQQDSEGNLKKIIVNDIELLDKPLGFE